MTHSRNVTESMADLTTRSSAPKAAPVVFLALATAALLAATSAAQAVPNVHFDITAAIFQPGTGYGRETQAQETNGTPTLLDVRFSTSVFSTQGFDLNFDSAFTFTLGTVGLFEPNAGGGIEADETDHLDVKAVLTFNNPLTTSQTLTATARAVTGSVSDGGIDYTLVWTPLQVDFGVNGLFAIDLLNLTFTSMGMPQNQQATIRLIRRPSDPEDDEDASVPEPTTLALVGLGIAGISYGRRKRVIA